MIKPTTGTTNKFKLCTPVDKPMRYIIKSKYLIFHDLSSVSTAHFIASHNVIAVKNVERAYTSDSTALNHWESVTANVSAAINALE